MANHKHLNAAGKGADDFVLQCIDCRQYIRPPSQAIRRLPPLQGLGPVKKKVSGLDGSVYESLFELQITRLACIIL